MGTSLVYIMPTPVALIRLPSVPAPDLQEGSGSALQSAPQDQQLLSSSPEALPLLGHDGLLNALVKPRDNRCLCMNYSVALDRSV